MDPSLKLIVSSGYSDALVTADFRKYGFDDVIPKPWTVVQVSEVFRSVLLPDNGLVRKEPRNSLSISNDTGGAVA